MNKQIKDCNIKELKLSCLDILTISTVELRQKITPEDLKILTDSLADDLVKYFPKLYINDIKESFKRGVRFSDEFHINVKTYFKWIKNYRQLLWDAQYEVHTLNKPIKEVPLYRAPKKLISNG